MTEPWHYYLMAGLYMLAGILHFVFPGMYLRILPDWVRNGAAVVYVSGVLEILFGAGLLFPDFKTPCLYGLMGLLVLFLPVHTHMLQDPAASMGVPRWILLLRIPLQGLLIYWAYWYL